MHQITRVSLKPIIKQSSQQLTAFLARFKFFEQTLDRCSGFASFMVDISRLFRAPSLRRRDASAEVKERPNHQRNSKKSHHSWAIKRNEPCNSMILLFALSFQFYCFFHQSSIKSMVKARKQQQQQ